MELKCPDPECANHYIFYSSNIVITLQRVHNIYSQSQIHLIGGKGVIERGVMNKLRIALCVAGLVSAPVLARSAIVYGPAACTGGCTDNSPIDANWGSNAIATVVNSGLSAAGPGGAATGPLFYWGSAYSGGDAAWNGSAAFGAGEVAITPVAGRVKLVSVDFGGWPNSAVDADWFVYNDDFSSLLASGSLVTDPAALTRVAINVTSTSTMRFQFSGTWELGLQNVVFGAVPEPSSWAMLIVGFGMVGASVRRKRLANA
jgi:hypothetical protein